MAVYTWSLSKASREAMFAAGARGLIAKTLPADQLGGYFVGQARRLRPVPGAFGVRLVPEVVARPKIQAGQRSLTV